MKKYDLHVAINEREKMVKEGYTHHIAWNGRVRAINLKKLTIMKTRRIEIHCYHSYRVGEKVVMYHSSLEECMKTSTKELHGYLVDDNEIVVEKVF
jgi:hypothetical protein